MTKINLTLEQLDKIIALIEKKIKKERKNVIDSGFMEYSEEFWDIFGNIKTEYIKVLALFLYQRHKLLPFDEETREEYNIWLALADLEELKKGK